MKKILLSALVACNLLYANPSEKNDDMGNEPQVLEFEKVLKELKNKKSELPPISTLNIENKELVKVDFNVIGTVKIGDKKYCYLLLNSNKTIKAVEGMHLKEIKISEITDYGINIIDDNGKSSFLPIIQEQINESDITFAKREQRPTQMNKER